MALKAGDLAPNFTLSDQDGNQFTLEDNLGSQRIVLYFYPKDETHGCIIEACGFRDNLERFTKLNTRIIGISRDNAESHQAFTRHHNLNFTLLSDTDNRIRKLYNVKPDFLGMIPGRKTFIIDSNGVILEIFEYQLNARKHVSESLITLENL